MGNFFAWLVDVVLRFYAVMAIAPFLPFGIVWAVVYFIRKDKKAATKLAMDVTTFALVGIVAALFNQVFGSTFGLYLILLLFLLGYGVLGNMQQRVKGRFDPRRTLRAVWRLGFLGLAAAYVLLMLVGIAQNL